MDSETLHDRYLEKRALFSTPCPLYLMLHAIAFGRVLLSDSLYSDEKERPTSMACHATLASLWKEPRDPFKGYRRKTIMKMMIKKMTFK